MIKVRRIAYATLETPDLARAIDYYRHTNGLALVDEDADSAFLAAGGARLAIELRRGARARCTRLAFELAPDADFAEIGRALAALGIASDQREAAAPGIARMLSFADPTGTAIDLFRGWTDVAASDATAGVGPLKLGHVAFLTPDPAHMATFYQQVLGFRISDWIGDFFVFLRCNPDHHTVNFLRGALPRLHHLAFELRDAGHIVVACDVLARRKIPLVWGPLRFGPGHNLATFHRNPDQQLVEFYAELDQMKDEELGYFEPRPWHRDRPQRPRVWTLGEDPVWGPPPPEGFM
jgi:catechol 2,3-dioxygenase-like lactoylglutathione lyase family enzyme